MPVMGYAVMYCNAWGEGFAPAQLRRRTGKGQDMKLYDGGRAPNPRRTRVFLAEKGITIPTEQVDLGALQQKSAAFTAVNPVQRVPVLVLDDGAIIAESIAICRYFEALY